MKVIELDEHRDEAATDDKPVSDETRRTVEAAFKSYEAKLFRAALRVTHDEDDARDAVQDAMVSALRHA